MLLHELENLENGKTFSSQGILNRREIREFYPKYWKNKGILDSFFLGFLIEVYLLNSLNKTLKKYWKMKKILVKSRKFVSPKMWEPCQSSATHCYMVFYHISVKTIGLMLERECGTNTCVSHCITRMTIRAPWKKSSLTTHLPTFTAITGLRYESNMYQWPRHRENREFSCKFFQTGNLDKAGKINNF